MKVKISISPMEALKKCKTRRKAMIGSTLKKLGGWGKLNLTQAAVRVSKKETLALPKHRLNYENNRVS